MILTNLTSNSASDDACSEFLLVKQTWQHCFNTQQEEEATKNTEKIKKRIITNKFSFLASRFLILSYFLQIEMLNL